MARVFATISTNIQSYFWLLQVPNMNVFRDHSFSMYAKFSKKLTFPTPWYAQSVCLAGGKKCYQGVRKDRQIYFTIINLEPKIMKDVVLTTPILHNMLIRSPGRDCGSCWWKWKSDRRRMAKRYNGYTFCPLETPRSEHNAKSCVKAIKDEFKNYFITEDTLEWQWKYC